MTAGNDLERPLRGVRALALRARVAAFMPGAFAVGLCLAVALGLVMILW